MGKHTPEQPHDEPTMPNLPGFDQGATEDVPAGLSGDLSQTDKRRFAKRNKVLAGVVAAGAFVAVGAPFVAAMNSGPVAPAASQNDIAAAAKPDPAAIARQQAQQADHIRKAAEQHQAEVRQQAEQQAREKAQHDAQQAMQQHRIKQKQAQQRHAAQEQAAKKRHVAEQAAHKHAAQKHAAQKHAAQKHAAEKHAPEKQAAARHHAAQSHSSDNGSQGTTQQASHNTTQPSSGHDSGSQSGSTTKSGYAKPAEGHISSGFGKRSGSSHKGVDIANSKGTPIHAAGSGKVISAGKASGFGQWVRIKQDNGTVTVYGHIESYSVSEGQHVQAGQQIAKMGSRGNSTGNHLHFQVQPGGANGKPVNPIPWLKERGITY